MLWTDAQPVDPARIVFVRDAEVLNLVIHLHDNPSSQLPRVVKVLPRVEEWMPLVHVLANIESLEFALKTNPEDADAITLLISGFDISLQPIVRLAVDITVAVRRLDLYALATMSSRLSYEAKASSALPEATKKWLVKLTSFMRELSRGCLRNVYLPAVFIHPDASASHKKWWLSEPSASKSFQVAASRFDAVINGGPPDDLLELKSWLTNTKDSFYCFHQLVAQTEGTCFRAASAFFATMSDRLTDAKHYVVAIMCLHRSVEWLLCAKCADLNLLDFTSINGPRISSTLEEVSFSRLMKALQEASTSLNGLEGALASLNAWRNLLAYTHHMTAPSDLNAKALIDTVRPHLAGIANREWERHVRTFGQPLPVSLEMILDPGGLIRAGFESLTPDQLSLENN